MPVERCGFKTPINKGINNIGDSSRLLKAENAGLGNALRSTTKYDRTAQSLASNCQGLLSKPEVVPPEQLKTDPVS